MAEYRIICTTQEHSNVPNDRAHVVAVGTGSSASTCDKTERKCLSSDYFAVPSAESKALS